jgi:UDP-sugar transporter A1/2/3
MLEFNATKGGLLKSIKENILDRPLDALKIAVPALLYLVQNTLLYVALSNLSAPLFQVTYQAKLVTTAVVSVILLNRRYSPKQWVCLVLLSIGVAIVVLGEKKDDPVKEEDDSAGKPEQSLAVGLIAVTIACFCSALAGVYFEKVLKKATTENGAARAPVSLWMRNVQLAFFSVLIAVFQGISQRSGDEEPKPFLHGFTSWVWVLVCLQAGGGLLVAAVIKYADNVLKGLATGVSVVVATACSAVFFRVPLTGQFSAGGLFILVSVYFFSNELPKFMTGGNKSVEMTPMLPK